MLPDIRSYVCAQEAPYKQAVKELVSIPSVCVENEDGLPFGKGVDDALRKSLEIADHLGFHTVYGEDGYYGYAETGAGAEMLGVLCHVDVVPAGDLMMWLTPPFQAVEQDGMIFGRGAQDNKGPTLAALFAAGALIQAGVIFNKRVRFIFSTDEEKDWRCIKRYAAQEEIPDIGFAPDARFPVVFAEKGVLQLHLEGENESGVCLSGGGALNAVPDVITYSGKRQEDVALALDKRGFAYRRTADSIEVLGQAAHVMYAERGRNAIARLAIVLADIGIHSKAIDFITQEVGEDPFAGRIFGLCEDEPSGKLKFNIGRIEIGEKERISIDMRLPVTEDKDRLLERLCMTAKRYGLSCRLHDWLAPLYFPLDHPLVQTLSRIYRQVTGDTISQPIASGGATLARALKNCVSFGALFQGKLVTEHQPNERLVLEDIFLAMQVYAQAIYELTR
jgi:succinyl-diaminopimelate desuccinylase